MSGNTLVTVTADYTTAADLDGRSAPAIDDFLTGCFFLPHHGCGADYLLPGWLRRQAPRRLGIVYDLVPLLFPDRYADMLRSELREHGHRYYVLDDPIIDDDVYDALKGAGAALCLSEREDNAPPPLVETAPWGYVRLRLEIQL